MSTESTVVMNKISTHKSGKSGREGVCMYTFVSGTGSKKKTETKHMTPGQAEAYKTQLQGK